MRRIFLLSAFLAFSPLAQAAPAAPCRMERGEAMCGGKISDYRRAGVRVMLSAMAPAGRPVSGSITLGMPKNLGGKTLSCQVAPSQLATFHAMLSHADPFIGVAFGKNGTCSMLQFLINLY